jgi:hypothetical protein
MLKLPRFPKSKRSHILLYRLDEMQNLHHAHLMILRTPFDRFLR